MIIHLVEFDGFDGECNYSRPIKAFTKKEDAEEHVRLCKEEVERIKSEVEAHWEEVKDDVMLKVLRSKFRNNEDLRNKLLETGDAILIEGTTGWHDNYWGICSCEKCGGVGKNMLGTLLMQVRDEMRSEEVAEIECPLCHRALPEDKEDPYNGA